MRASDFLTEKINQEIVEPDFYAEKDIDIEGVGPLKLVAKNLKPGPYTPQFQVTVFLPDGQSIGHFRFLVMDYEEGSGFKFLSKFKSKADPYVIGANVRVWSEFQRKGIARAVYQWVQNMGNDLQPSTTQTDAGKSMWRSFEKAPLEERKKRRTKSRWAFSGPGGWYGYYYGHSGESEAGGGGESVSENRSDKSNVIFLSDTAAIVGQEHGKKLKLSPDEVEKIKAITSQHGAWYEGNGMDQELTKGIIDDYQGSWDDDLLSPAIKGYPAAFLYVLFSNIKENDTVKGKIGSDPDSSIFDRILDTQPSTNYFPDRQFDADTLAKFLEAVSEGPYDFVQMSQAPATEQNVAKFFKLGEKLMWPSNWEEYPNRAGRVAKSVNDLRDKFLASRKSGVYVTGSDHLIAVRKFLNQRTQDVAEAHIDAHELVDVFIRGRHRGETITQLVVRNFPNQRIPALVQKLVDEYNINPNSIVYGPSRSVQENFADGRIKGKSRPGRVKRAGASCAGSVTDLRARAKKYGGERGRMYHWCANMKSGRRK